MSRVRKTTPRYNSKSNWSNSELVSVNEIGEPTGEQSHSVGNDGTMIVSK